MKKEIYDITGMTKLGEEDAEPVCGEDFCDSCGDCLACYGDGDCCNGEDGAGEPHRWVQYGDTPTDKVVGK